MFNGSFSAVVTQFDALGRKTSVGMPEILPDNANPSHVTTFTYDSFGRTTKIKQPDQADSTAVRISYTGARQIDRTVSIAQSGGDADAITTEVHDALGRLYSVTEQSEAPRMGIPRRRTTTTSATASSPWQMPRRTARSPMTAVGSC